MGILLAFLCFLGLYIFSPFLILFSFFKVKGWNNLSNHYRDVADAGDKFGNIIAAPLFNVIMIKPEGFQFGHPNEYISDVLAANKRTGTLRTTGKMLCWMLIIANDPSFK